MRLPPIDIIVAFYGRPDLLTPLFASIHRLRRELQELDCAIIAVNDSPGDQSLRENLVREAGRLDGILECTILENEANEGFVRSANRALRETIRRGHDAILLNSDTVLFPGAVSEMQRAAYLDPTIGFVSPRSNNASVCSLPHQREYHSLPPEESFAIYSVLASYLPDHHYVPTAVGFCLYIKLPVLGQVGVFDDRYSPGYNEENDLIMRAQLRGYRAALANHAYVYHLGSASFSGSATGAAELDKRNLETLTNRYPHFLKHVDKYYKSEHRQAEALLPSLITDSTGHWSLLLDLSALPAGDEHALQAIREVAIRAAEQWRQWFSISVAGHPESLEFHQLHDLPGVSIVNLETSEQLFAVAVRFGLPCEYQHVARLSQAAVCNVYAVLDPVIPDASPFEEQPLDEVWDFVFQHADAVIYESDFARDQLRAQYRCHPAVRERVADPSGVRNSVATDIELATVRRGLSGPCPEVGLSEMPQHRSDAAVGGRNPHPTASRNDASWRFTSESIGQFLKETVECVSFELILKRRLRAIRLAEARMMEAAEMRRHFEVAESDRAARLAVIEEQGRQLGEMEAERNVLRSEVADLRWHFEVAESDRAARLEVIEEQGRQLGEMEVERNALRSEVADLRRHLEETDGDRVVRLAAVEEQKRQLGEIEAECSALRSQAADLRRHFEESEADRAARLAVIEEQGRQLGEMEAERNALRSEVADLQRHFEVAEADRAARLAVIEEQGRQLEMLKREPFATIGLPRREPGQRDSWSRRLPAVLRRIGSAVFPWVR